MLYFLSKLQTTNTTELLCLCRLIQMDHEHIPQQALYWDVPGQTRTNWRDVVKKDHQHIPQQALYWDVPGQTRTNWRDVVKKDLQSMVLWRMGLTWEVKTDVRVWPNISIETCVESRSRSSVGNADSMLLLRLTFVHALLHRNKYDWLNFNTVCSHLQVRVFHSDVNGFLR